MPRSDLVLSLVKAGASGDQRLLRTTVEALAAEERAKQHHQLADRLVQNLQAAKRGVQDVPRTFDGGHGGLLFQIEAQRPIESIILPEEVERACQKLIEEHHRADLLRSYQLEPRHRVLLVGPPGNGKTSLAEALAHSLALPLFTVRYEAVVGSYLGETSSRLRRLFDFARTHACVLFFDEFDTLGKERGDVHETGEIKRVVSSLLLQIDSLPSYVIVITATNHPELLDRAVWRRFQMRLELLPPGPKQIRQWVERVEAQVGRSLGVGHAELTRRLRPESYAELEDFSLDVRRRIVLAGSDADLTAIVQDVLREWTTRFRPKRNLTAKKRGRS